MGSLYVHSKDHVKKNKRWATDFKGIQSLHERLSHPDPLRFRVDLCNSAEQLRCSGAAGELRKDHHSVQASAALRSH